MRHFPTTVLKPCKPRLVSGLREKRKKHPSAPLCLKAKYFITKFSSSVFDQHMSCKINRYALFWPDIVQYDSFESWLQGIIFFVQFSEKIYYLFFPPLYTEIKKWYK